MHERLAPPISLLGRHVRRADDADRRVDEEEREDLAVAGLRGVRELEGGDLVLDDVGEGKEAALQAGDGTGLLDGGAVRVESEDGLHEIVLVLRIVNVINVGRGHVVSESEAAGRDVVGVVIVECGGTDVLILEHFVSHLGVHEGSGIYQLSLDVPRPTCV